MLILSGGDAEDGGERCDVQPVTLIYKSVTPCNTASVVETHTHRRRHTNTHIPVGSLLSDRWQQLMKRCV